MTEHNHTARSGLVRVYGLLKLGVFLLFLGWLGQWAYVRITTRPPGAPPYEEIIAELLPLDHGDAGERITNAMSWLPARPYGQFSIWRANLGPWDPAGRLALADIIRYLELPGTRKALAGVTEAAKGQFPVDPTFSYYAPLRTAVRLLAARARYHWEGRADYDAAVADLLTCFHLARGVYEQPLLVSQLVGATYERTACAEACQLAMSHQAPAAALRALQQGIAGIELPKRPRARVAAETEAKLCKARLDHYYAKDASGRNWLDVEARLYAWAESDQSVRDKLTRAGGLWNLFSFVFNSRQAVEAKIDAIFEAFAVLENLHGASAYEGMERLRRLVDEVNELDGPLQEAWLAWDRTFTKLLHPIMEREATLTILAIEQYRHAHGGTHPAVLEELVPDYLASVPIDWYSGESLRYRVDGDKYVLYSINSDRVDNGGDRGKWFDWHSPDYVFTAERAKGGSEEYVLQDRKNAAWPDEEAEDESRAAGVAEDR